MLQTKSSGGGKVALYARVSTRDKGQDTENQLSQLRAFVATQGWTVAHEYVDRATGKHSDREQFQRLFADASQRKFDLVLFWSLDRFSREGVLETLNHLQRLAAYGVGYRSFTEQYLDSCGIFKDAVLAILAVIAKQERGQTLGADHRRPGEGPARWTRWRPAAGCGRSGTDGAVGRGRLDHPGDWRRDGNLRGECLPAAEGSSLPAESSAGALMRVFPVATM